MGEGCLFSLYIYIENLKKSSCQKPLDRFQYNLAEMFPWWPFTKIVQAIMVCQKTWPLVGGAFFPYISILKPIMIFLSETTRPISIWHCRNVSLVTLYQDCSSSHDSSKNLAARGRGLFFIQKSESSELGWNFNSKYTNLFAQVSDIGLSWSLFLFSICSKKLIV